MDKSETTASRIEEAAENLLNAIEGKTKSEAVTIIIGYSRKIYRDARAHEREDLHGIANQN